MLIEQISKWHPMLAITARICAQKWTLVVSSGLGQLTLCAYIWCIYEQLVNNIQIKTLNGKQQIIFYILFI